MSVKMKPAAKFALIFIGLAALFAIFKFTPISEWIVPEDKNQQSMSDDAQEATEEGVPLIRIGVVTWGGYAGGQYFNNGFAASTKSRFYTDYKILVQFKVMDDFEASRNAWKADEVDLMWVTADAFPTETEALADYKPKFIFQADWSRGGDAIVVRQGIKTVQDLRGKRIAVAFGTPSHTFLLITLEMAGLKPSDVQIVEAKSAIDAATTFKSEQVDAAVVWSPDDLDCTRNVIGSKVLTNTKTATHIIADGFFAKESFIEGNREPLKSLIKGWLQGSAEINNDPSAKQKAIEILKAGLNMDQGLAENAINNVRLATYGDNVNFFNLNGNYNGVTGANLYNKMSKMYKNIGFIKNIPPSWISVSDMSLLNSISLTGSQNAAEGSKSFAPTTAQEVSTPALSTKEISVSFASGSYTLDENAKYIIQIEFGELSRHFANSKIRIEGNTDNVGNPAANKLLSEKRAKAVADFLVSKYGYDRNKFVIIGNGPDKPVSDNGSADGKAKNRRTDFMILQ